MRPHRLIGLSLLSLAFGSGWSPASGGDSAAEMTLKGRGLAKSGRTFVIEDEKAVLAKMKEARSSFAAYASLAERLAAFERSQTESARLEEHRVELKANLDDLNQRIIEQAASSAGNGPMRQGPGTGPASGPGAASPLILQRDEVRDSLAEVTLRQKALKADSPAVKDKGALDDEVKKKAEAFKSALADLRGMFDQATKKYAELGADEAVKRSLTDLEKAGKVKPKLGPSEAFAAGAKELDQAERRFLGKKPAAPANKKKAAKAKR